MDISNDCRPEAGRTREILSTTLTVCFSFFLAFVLMGAPQVEAGHPGAASGRGITATVVEGNPTCSTLISGIPGLQEFRINNPVDVIGAFDGDLTLNIDVRNTSLGTVFDWEASGGTVHGIFVKGGPRGNDYQYPVSYPSDTALHSPVNHNNNRYYGLSHISFCYVPGEPSIDVQKTCAQQTVNNQVITTRNTVTLDNDGDFELTNVMVREDQIGASCSITKVDTKVVNTALTVGVWALVPNGNTFDGNLVVGESVDLEITCTGSALNIANKISGKGDWAQGTVMEMDTSNPASECPFSPDPMVSIDKDCPAETSVRLMAMAGMLVAEVCPEITVTNESSTEPLSTVFVSDTQIAVLSGLGVDVGPLAPLASVKLGADLGYDLCYLPSAPEVAPFDDGDTKYLPSHAGFLNTATVDADGQFGGNDVDSDDTALRDAGGNILYLLDEYGNLVLDTDGNMIPLSECPLCAPCPDCPN